jgi:hypothetical protein
MTIYHLRPVSGLWVPDRMAVAATNLFSDKDMRFYLPLSVGLAFKESEIGAAFSFTINVAVKWDVV